MDIKNKVKILDGGMGTMLLKSGLKTGEVPEELNIDNPEMIIDVHKKYIQSGSDIIYTCTFGANRNKLKKYSVSDVVKKAVENAKIARGEKDVKIALDIGPIGEMIEPMGTLKFEEAYDIFEEIIISGVESNVDIITIETMTDLYEVKAAVLAAKENSNLPIFVTMSFDEDHRTFAGVSIETFINSIGGLGIDAIGINCSLGPFQMYSMVEKISALTDLDIIVKPNAGLPRVDGGYDLSSDGFSKGMEKIFSLGVKYLGGCCGTDDKYILELSNLLKDREVPKRNIKKLTGPSSGTKFLNNTKFKIVGERLNPTGKKEFQQALKDSNMSYFIKKAIEQVDAGADILDLNVGYPRIDESLMQQKIIKSIQSVLDTPIQIDSTKKEAIEAGLRVYNGKAIVNSVNGEDEKLEEILPLVKKYNAQVIGLTLDENGISYFAIDRFKIAEKIVNKALSYGISKEDIYIDCLALTVSSQPEGAMETLKTIKMVKEKLGVKTALGVSNISFGMPNRELINSSFLNLAMYAGLDLAIINPNSKLMMDTIRTFKVLNNEENSMEEYISSFSNATKSEIPKVKEEYSITEAISKGMDSVVKEKVLSLLDSVDELEIINNYLIPALDKVGNDYENGDIFLPQLIKSANSAQCGFEVIKNSINKKGEKSISKGDIIVATVKGDVHDIGKNIAKVILENYGYNVIDLGKDVEIEEIVKVSTERNIKLVGLSALMTTTLENMKETIKELKIQIPNVKVMVGGAVLTKEYSKEIDADFYLKDAKVNVEVAKEVLKNE